MERLTPRELVRAYSEVAETHCIYLTLDNAVSITELVELRAFFKGNKLDDFYFSVKDCTGIFVFDTEKEMTEFFDLLEGTTAVKVRAYSNGEFVYES